MSLIMYDPEGKSGTLGYKICQHYKIKKPFIIFNF
jgi:hypothetical protein